MEWIVTILFMAVPLLYSPGPANIFLAAVGSQYGWKKTLPLATGISTIFLTVSIITSLFIQEITLYFPHFVDSLRVVSFAYLLYLAYKIFKIGEYKLDQSHKNAPTFLNGVLFQIINPKVWMVHLSLCSVFTGQFDHSFITLITVVFLIHLTSQTAWIGSGIVMAKLFKTMRAQHMVNVALSVLLLFTSIWMIGEIVI